MPLKEFQFESQGIAYIRSRLSEGSTLSKLSQSLPLEDGIIRAYLPETLSMDMATDTLVHGCPAVDEAAEESEDFVVRFIRDHLKTKGRPYAVFEHALARSSDPWLSSAPDVVFVFQSEVYYFLCSDAAKFEVVKEMLHNVRSGFFVRGILSSSKQVLDIKNRTEVNLDVLQAFVDNAQHLIVGAYDGSAYLIWSR